MVFQLGTARIQTTVPAPLPQRRRSADGGGAGAHVMAALARIAHLLPQAV